MKLLGVWLLMIHTTYSELNQTVDLGYGFDQNTLYWSGMPNFVLTDVKRMEDPFFVAKKFDAAEHGGTHLDAPYHFNPDGWTVADIPLERLIVPGVKIDMSKAAVENPDTEVTVQDLEKWEELHGPLPNNVAVIFYFGWSSKYPNKEEYFGIQNGNDSDFHFPGVSAAAAEWLVNSSKVVGVGVDTASVDAGISKDFIAHQIMLKANMYFMENLALGDVDLPPRGFLLTVMPMKIINGTGAPLRIIAQPDRSSEAFFSMILAWIISLWVSLTSMFK